jgi:glycerol uptake facilitator-like aquaporin
LGDSAALVVLVAPIVGAVLGAFFFKLISSGKA